MPASLWDVGVPVVSLLTQHWLLARDVRRKSLGMQISHWGIKAYFQGFGLRKPSVSLKAVQAGGPWVRLAALAHGGGHEGVAQPRLPGGSWVWPMVGTGGGAEILAHACLLISIFLYLPVFL